VTRSDTRDREGEAKRKVSGVTICSETDATASEHFKGAQGGIVARFPRLPDLKRGLALIHVARAFNPEHTVNLVSTMSAIAAYEAIKSGFNRGNGVLRFAEDPYLDHISGLPVVAGG
jgi:hypothetical protein